MPVAFAAGFWLPGVAQQTELPISDIAPYREALELYDKEKYGAAFDRFQHTIELADHSRAEVVITSEYYSALCALQLFNRDAEHLLTRFVEDHPESPYVRKAYFHLGRYNYRKRKYEKVIAWLEKVDIYDLDQSELPEYYFELGYSHFQEENYEKAAQLLFEIKDQESAYQAPANYYYSHIAYLDGKWETALTGFKGLLDHSSFGGVVPYYIAQIYYNQNKYDELIEFVTPMLETVVPKREAEVAHLLGRAHYKKNQFDQAIPYLEQYREKAGQGDREDSYALGYAYYRTGQYREAMSAFGQMYSLEPDLLAQLTLYHMGECYVQLGEKRKAITVFDQAYEMDLDAKVTEDALFQYAKLSYETAYDPYNKAIKAFKEYIFRYPKSPNTEDAYQYLLSAYLTSKDYDMALTSIEGITNPDPRLKEAYQTVAFNQGVKLFDSERYVQAISYFERSRGYLIDKELGALALYWMGESYHKRKDYKKAIAYYTDFYFAPGAILLPYFNKANYNIAYANYEQGQENYKDALVSFRKFVQYTKEDNKILLTDANLRIGDLFYLDQNYVQAITYYEKALSYDQFDADYAYFQKAVAEGLLKQYDRKEASLQSLLAKYPQSRYKDDAAFQLGLNAEKQGDNALALSTYKKLIDTYPKSPFVRKSLLKAGFIRYRQSEYDLALTKFKTVLEDFNSYEDKREAVQGVKLVCQAMGRPELIAEILQSVGMELPESHLDSLTYLTYEQNYLQGRYENSIKEFTTYLDNFKQPIFAVSAHYYRGQLYFDDLLYEDALEDYEFVINSDPNTFSKDAYDKASYILYSDNEFERALPYFESLEELADDQGVRFRAEDGLMRCSYQLKDYQQALKYSKQILKRQFLEKPIFIEAQYKRAKSALALDMTDEAWDAFEITADTMPNELGAEAAYHLAKIRFQQDDFNDAEDRVNALVNDFAGYHDWIARGLILLSDIYVSTGDMFQAKATLKSIVENYEGDPLISEEAARKLDALNAASEKPEKREQEELEIEFNDSEEFDVDDLFEEEVIEEEDLIGRSTDRSP